jgi:predicted Zn-dependent protease
LIFPPHFFRQLASVEEYMRRRNLTIFPLVIAALIGAWQYFGAEKVVIPEIGRVARVGLSSEQETAIGLQSYREVVSQSDLVKNGPDYDAVVRVARRLTAVVGESGRGFDWQVSVIRSDQANAFCLPGGKIVIYTGILKYTQTDAGLAAVMGHEMAHALARHGSQRILQNSVTQTVMTGASLSFSEMDWNQRRMVLAALGAGAQFGVLLPFSRKHESEADELGLIYMARAGYDPAEAIAFWQRMAGSGGNQPPEFASTHPSHGTRIEHLRELLPRVRTEYEKSASASNAEERSLAR